MTSNSRTADALRERLCGYCLAGLYPPTWDVQDTGDAAPGERNIGECAPCGVTWSVVGSDFEEHYAAGVLGADLACLFGGLGTGPGSFSGK